MKTKPITTLAELRLAKKVLNDKMVLADKRTREGFLYSTFNQFIDSMENSSILENLPVSSGVNTALNFISGQAGSRLHMGKIGKSILSIAVVIAAPIIAQKVQEFIDKR